MSGTHVIEHRRVLGGDWIKVQTVGEDLLERAEETVVAYNEASGVGDWRVRPVGGNVAQSLATIERESSPKIQKPTLRQRFRFWWIMRTSKRAR